MNLQPLALSFEIAFIAIALTGVVGIALGLLLATRRFVGRDLVDALVTAPMVLPPTVLGYYLLVILGVNSRLGHAWEALFGEPIVFTKVGAVLAAAVGALPLVTKAARAAFEDVDPRLIDAARTLGASSARAFWTVRLPLARRGIFAGLTLGWARALGDFGITLMVAGSLPGKTQTAALAVYDLMQQGRDSEAAGLAAVLAALATVALLIANRLFARRIF